MERCAICCTFRAIFGGLKREITGLRSLQGGLVKRPSNCIQRIRTSVFFGVLLSKKKKGYQRAIIAIGTDSIRGFGCCFTCLSGGSRSTSRMVGSATGSKLDTLLSACGRHTTGVALNWPPRIFGFCIELIGRLCREMLSLYSVDGCRYFSRGMNDS